MKKHRALPVYVVEVNFDDWSSRDRWEPCAEAHLTRRAAVAAMRDWRDRNTGARYRVTRYVREVS